MCAARYLYHEAKDLNWAAWRGALVKDGSGRGKACVARGG